jgi:hypothetical protein
MEMAPLLVQTTTTAKFEDLTLSPQLDEPSSTSVVCFLD